MLQILRQLNLTPKLTLIFVLFAAVLLAGVDTFAYFSGRTGLETAAISNLRLIANEKEAELDNWVLDKQTDLIQLARSPALINQLAILRAAPPDSAATRRAHAQLVAELKPRTRVGHHLFLELFVIEPEQGKIIVSTNPAEEGKFKEDRPYFINGKEAPYVQPPYYSLVRQGPAMTVAVPVRSAGGELLGVLAGRLVLDELNAIVQRSTDLHQTLDVFLINTANLFVTQPRYISNPAVLQRQITRPEINRCLQGENGIVLADDYRDVPAVIIYRWLPDQKLCLKAKLDQAEVLAPVAAFGRTLGLIGLLGLLAASLVALALARAIIRPVQTLQQGAERFGRGDLDVRLPETTGGELGRLAREFNRMAASLAEKEAQLRAHADELEQKVAERTAALQASEAELKALFAAMPDVVLVLDREGYYLKIAPTDPSRLYKPAEELVGKTLHDVFPKEQADAFVDYVQLALDTKQPVNYEYGLKIDKDEFWFVATVSPMTADAVVWVARDITDRKQMEEELRRSNAELQQFAYVASHDLQEPLRMVTSYLQLLERRYKNHLDADAYDFIEFAVDGARRMKQLINDLLAYSRVGTRGKPFEPTDCEAVVRQVLADLQLTIADSGAQITLDPLPTVMGDDAQLAQLFQNLLSNALKFRNEQPPQIHVGAKQGQDGWTFWVQDNGIGLEPDYADRIFVIFQRLHSRTEYPGTGIGLAICKKIVERHGGRIWVESGLGPGTTFYFTIPTKGAD